MAIAIASKFILKQNNVIGTLCVCVATLISAATSDELLNFTSAADVVPKADGWFYLPLPVDYPPLCGKVEWKSVFSHCILLTRFSVAYELIYKH